ncbi:hypothetical protein GCM10027054_37360 [Isoptericola nanjingensis]
MADDDIRRAAEPRPRISASGTRRRRCSIAAPLPGDAGRDDVAVRDQLDGADRRVRLVLRRRARDGTVHEEQRATRNIVPRATASIPTTRRAGVRAGHDAETRLRRIGRTVRAPTSSR